MNENANKQAFPSTSISDVYSGLTKREYFAVMAMQGYLASYPSAQTSNAEHMAKKCIEYADELLTQLSQSK